METGLNVGVRSSVKEVGRSRWSVTSKSHCNFLQNTPRSYFPRTGQAQSTEPYLPRDTFLAFHWLASQKGRKANNGRTSSALFSVEPIVCPNQSSVEYKVAQSLLYNARVQTPRHLSPKWPSSAPQSAETYDRPYCSDSTSNVDQQGRCRGGAHGRTRERKVRWEDRATGSTWQRTYLCILESKCKNKVNCVTKDKRLLLGTCLSPRIYGAPYVSNYRHSDCSRFIFARPAFIKFSRG